MKKVISGYFAILISLLISIGNCYGAFKFEYNGMKFECSDEDSKSIELTKVEKSGYIIEVPDKITLGEETYVVDKIGSRAFTPVSQTVRSVLVPPTVKELKAGAFYDCKFLSVVKLPRTLEVIGDFAFANCVSLKRVVIPRTVKSIGEDIFLGCDRIFLTIEEGMKELGDSAFFKCEALRMIDLPNSLRKIGNHAFAFNYNLSTVRFPDRITSIGTSAFKFCLEFEDIILPKSLKEISDSSFFMCINLRSVEFNESLSSIGSFAFAYTKLSELDIPSHIKSIGTYAFNNCRALKHVFIKDGVENISSKAFSNCCKIVSFFLPENLNSLSPDIFQDSKITNLVLPLKPFNVDSEIVQNADIIHCKSSTPPFANIRENVVIENKCIYVPFKVMDMT